MLYREIIAVCSQIHAKLNNITEKYSIEYREIIAVCSQIHAKLNNITEDRGSHKTKYRLGENESNAT